MQTERLYGVAVCCTEWTVVIGYPIRRCGLCGEIPVVVKVED